MGNRWILLATSVTAIASASAAAQEPQLPPGILDAVDLAGYGPASSQDETMRSGGDPDAEGSAEEASGQPDSPVPYRVAGGIRGVTAEPADEAAADVAVADAREDGRGFEDIIVTARRRIEYDAVTVRGREGAAQFYYIRQDHYARLAPQLNRPELLVNFEGLGPNPVGGDYKARSDYVYYWYPLCNDRLDQHKVKTTRPHDRKVTLSCH